jgi:hypothetical protein
LVLICDVLLIVDDGMDRNTEIGCCCSHLLLHRKNAK